MWTVSQVILLIMASAHADMTTGEQEHNVTKREIDPYIIGGFAVSMPTAVLILIKPDEYTTNSCSGTILSKDIVLSAGHCFDIPGSYANVTTIVAGVSDLQNYLTGRPNIAQVFNVEKVTIHPRYRHVDGEPGEQEELIWDLAIIKLSSKMEIETNPNMEAVKLPPPGIRHVGKKVRVGGWGRYTPNSGASLMHQAIDVMINPDGKCSDTYDVGEFLPSQMFCAGERGQTTCRGDSGSGALFYWNNKKIIIGVLSFGTKGCKTASVFQRVEHSLPWIFRETNLRPAYEVFEDDLLYKEFLDDAAAHSPTSQTAILISGGIRAHPGDVLSTLELFVPSTGITKVCNSMTLPGPIRSHTINIIDNKPVICGGIPSIATCIIFTDGKWEEYSKLVPDREGQGSWLASNNDIVLLGGDIGDAKSTSIVPNGGGQSVEGFDLKDNAASSCAINDGDSTILTGGRGASSKVVARYNLVGFVEYLPELNLGRLRHGCGSYRQSDGSLTLVVAAGAGTSTETLVVLPGNKWTDAAPLPRELVSVSFASLNNKFYILGGFFGPRTEILEFDGDEWKKVGDLTEIRNLGAATAVDLEKIEFCK